MSSCVQLLLPSMSSERSGFSFHVSNEATCSMTSQLVIGYDARYLAKSAAMEELYTTLLPYGQVHCMTWSGANLVAVSLSEEILENVTEGHQRFGLPCSKSLKAYFISPVARPE